MCTGDRSMLMVYVLKSLLVGTYVNTSAYICIYTLACTNDAIMNSIF